VVWRYKFWLWDKPKTKANEAANEANTDFQSGQTTCTSRADPFEN
jgi:hypothetical protein